MSALQRYIELKVVQTRYWVVDNDFLAKMRLAHCKPQEGLQWHDLIHSELISEGSERPYKVYDPNVLAKDDMSIILMLQVHVPSIADGTWSLVTVKNGSVWGKPIDVKKSLELYYKKWLELNA